MTEIGAFGILRVDPTARISPASRVIKSTCHWRVEVKSTQTERVYEAIYADIAEGRAAPNLSMAEADLTKRFGTSRTPVREAMLFLERDRLIERSGGKYQVVGLTYQRAANVFMARVAIEGMAMWTAMHVLKPEHLRDLDAILEKSEYALEKEDFQGLALLNSEFHNYISSIAENEYFVGLSRTIEALTQRYRRASLAVFDRGPRAVADHRKIVEVMREGSPAVAEEAMRRHVLEAGHSFLSALTVFSGESAETPSSIAVKAGATSRTNLVKGVVRDE